MKKTILFSSSGSGDSNYTLTILSGEFNSKNQTGYVKINDNKKMLLSLLQTFVEHGKIEKI